MSIKNIPITRDIPNLPNLSFNDISVWRDKEVVRHVVCTYGSSNRLIQIVPSYSVPWDFPGPIFCSLCGRLAGRKIRSMLKNRTDYALPGYDLHISHQGIVINKRLHRQRSWQIIKTCSPAKDPDLKTYMKWKMQPTLIVDNP